LKVGNVLLDPVSGCLFCAIAAGDIPSAHLYEDGRVAAFLDIKPLARGHALVVPKRHAAKLEDASAEDRHALTDAAALLAPILCRATGAKDYTIAINNGPEAGQEVPHVHLHIVPRRSADAAGPIHALFRDPPSVSSEDLHDLAVQVQAAVEAGGRARASKGNGPVATAGGR
jgi:histidine triad (HIT) family protein